MPIFDVLRTASCSCRGIRGFCEKEEGPAGAGGAPAGRAATRVLRLGVGFDREFGDLGDESAGDFGGDGSGGGTYSEPFGGASDSAQGTSPFGGADGGIALFGEGGGLGLFVGQVALGGG